MCANLVPSHQKDAAIATTQMVYRREKSCNQILYDLDLFCLAKGDTETICEILNDSLDEAPCFLFLLARLSGMELTEVDAELGWISSEKF